MTNLRGEGNGVGASRGRRTHCFCGPTGEEGSVLQGLPGGRACCWDSSAQRPRGLCRRDEVRASPALVQVASEQPPWGQGDREEGGREPGRSACLSWSRGSRPRPRPCDGQRGSAGRPPERAGDPLLKKRGQRLERRRPGRLGRWAWTPSSAARPAAPASPLCPALCLASG